MMRRPLVTCQIYAAFRANQALFVVFLIFAVNAIESDWLFASIAPSRFQFHVAFMTNHVTTVLEHVVIFLYHDIVKDASIAKIASEAFSVIMQVTKNGVSEWSCFRPHIFRWCDDLFFTSRADVGVSRSREFGRDGRRTRLARTVIRAFTTKRVRVQKSCAWNHESSIACSPT